MLNYPMQVAKEFRLPETQSLDEVLKTIHQLIGI
jgi:hypothetical protein